MTEIEHEYIRTLLHAKIRSRKVVIENDTQQRILNEMIAKGYVMHSEEYGYRPTLKGIRGK
jgi:DNA-binding IclR family transcriptional regulator